MIFVTGTGTGVGKTYVASLLARTLRFKDVRVGVMKPIETGCGRDAGGALVPSDALLLRDAAGIDLPLEVVNPYRFEPPVSPHAAAEQAGVEIDVDTIRRVAEDLRRRCDLLILEGAGGLLVPIGEGLVMADLVASLGAQLLVVAKDALGTINHTLLTVEAARARKLRLLGVVLNAEPTDDESTAGNAAAIQRFGQVEVLARIARGAGSIPLRFLVRVLEARSAGRA